MYRDVMTRICLYDPVFPSDSPVGAIKKIVDEEMKKQRTMDLAEVTSIYPHSSSRDNDNYECDVKLKNGGNELRRVPIMTPHIGFTWVPNIGDLVLIGYIGGNVNSPIVIGSLYNDDQRPSINKANCATAVLPDDIPLMQSDDYIRKDWDGFEWCVNGIVMAMRKTEKDGTYFTFHDAVEKKFHVVYDASGKLVLRSKTDIMITCDGTLTLEAGSINISGDITMNGGSIKAKGTQLDLEGNAVEIKGSGSVTIKGANVDVNGSGATSIKGGVVKIN